MKRIDIMKYTVAVREVHNCCVLETPIKVTEFMKAHKLTNYFFDAMKHLGIIKPVISELREGTIFSFKRMAENETFSSIAMRVCDLMGDWSKNPSIKPSNRRIKEPAPNSFITGDIHAKLRESKIADREAVEALIGNAKPTYPNEFPTPRPKVKKSKASVMITFEYEGDTTELAAQIANLLEGKTGAKFMIEAHVN